MARAVAGGTAVPSRPRLNGYPARAPRGLPDGSPTQVATKLRLDLRGLRLVDRRAFAGTRSDGASY